MTDDAWTRFADNNQLKAPGLGTNTQQPYSARDELITVLDVYLSAIRTRLPDPPRFTAFAFTRSIMSCMLKPPR